MNKHISEQGKKHGIKFQIVIKVIFAKFALIFALVFLLVGALSTSAFAMDKDAIFARLQEKSKVEPFLYESAKLENIGNDIIFFMM